MEKTENNNFTCETTNIHIVLTSCVIKAASKHDIIFHVFFNLKLGKECAKKSPEYGQLNLAIHNTANDSRGVQVASSVQNYTIDLNITKEKLFPSFFLQFQHTFFTRMISMSHNM